MFAVSTIEEIEAIERELGERHIIALLFVRPSLPDAREIISEFNYIHVNSGRYCSVYAVGYYADTAACQYSDMTEIIGTGGAAWHYSDSAFVAFKNRLEERLKWKYSGDIELVLLQSNPGGVNILNFEHYLAIDVNYGIKHEYIDSFPRFMEALIRSSKEEVETVALAGDILKSRLKLGEVAARTIDDCRKIPSPVRKIIRDRLFYRTSRSYT